MNNNESTQQFHAETAAVRRVLEQVYRAWADNDADAFAALYAQDVTVVMPGVFHKGKDAVRNYMAAAFAGPFRGSRGIDEPQDIRIIDGQTAIVASTAGILLAGETELPTEREVTATWVLSRQGDDWYIAAYSNTPAHR